MAQAKKSALKATPEIEDFRHKYTDEGSGKIGSKLLDGYFKAVEDLVNKADLPTSRTDIKALEIGCGEGYSTQRLHTFLPKHITLEASEYVDQQIPFARENNPDIRITRESIYDLRRKDSSVQLAFLLEVLEHLDHPGDGLKEIARILEPGGWLVLGVPREPLWRALNMARGKYVQDFGNTPGHLNHWSSGSLVHFIEEHFGTVVSVARPLPWTLVLAQKR